MVGARYERSRRDSSPRAHRRTRRAGVDERRRGARRVLSVDRGDCRCQGGDSDGGRRGTRWSWPTRRITGSCAGCPVFRGRVVTFGTEVEADVTASGVEDLGLDGMRARLRSPAGAATVRTPLLGRGNLANVLAAIAVATTLEVPLAAAGRAGERTVEAPPHRGRIHGWRAAVVVIDDSYNASPLAVETALAALPPGPAAGRRVAVLGEMLELGGRAVDLHRSAGRAAAGLGLLLTVGGDPARALGRAAVDAGAAAANVLHCDSSEEAAARAAALIPRRRHRARQGVEGRADRSDRGAALRGPGGRNGAGVMPVSPAVSAGERRPVHHRPHRRGPAPPRS